jgi:pantoate--beta-alanine ligase
MGFLHEGHHSLMRAARQRCDVVIASIFVNPAQFGAGEDLGSYPRDLDRDTAGCEAAGVDLLWLPDAAALYPPGYSTWVDVQGVTQALCGGARPGHFRGVTTIVNKLFNIVEPDAAFFGQKDYQQLRTIERMTVDLDLAIEIVGCPIVREPDGLALSSRNIYLSQEERAAARCLRRGLDAAEVAFAAGVRDARTLEAAAAEVIDAEPLAQLEYAEVRDAQDLAEVETADRPVVLAVAALLGPARLIDNQVLST